MAEEKNQEQNLSQLLQIRRDKLKELQGGGRDPFQITKYEVTHDSAAIKADFDAMEGSQVSLAGRLMSKRGMGKAMFCDLQDGQGRIQLYVRIDELGEEAFARFKKVDIGDIVGVEGEAFRTKRGEISVKAAAVTLLSKSLLPLPEKYHGLTDKETRYRQRYVDLIVNPEVREAFVIRSKFIRHVRAFLDGRGYMEVETPFSTPSPAAPQPGPSSPTTILWISTCTCASPPSCPSSGSLWAVWSGYTRLAAFSATRVWTLSITRSSPRWRPMSPTPISTI